MSFLFPFLIISAALIITISYKLGKQNGKDVF